MNSPLIPRFYCVAALVLLFIVTLSFVQIAISLRFIASRMPPTGKEIWAAHRKGGERAAHELRLNAPQIHISDGKVKAEVWGSVSTR